MPYSVRLMCREDIAQVNQIDREAFPTQWPPPNYQHELQNELARYIVACDESRTVDESVSRASADKGRDGLFYRLRRFFDRDHLPGDELSSSNGQYIVGFAGIWVLADDAHVTNIAVRNSYQRRGIGELLLISIIDLSKELKASIMTLEVRVSNTAAQSLYRKYGFTQVGLRRGYYTDNREDGAIMSTEEIVKDSYQTLFQQQKQAYSRRWGIPDYELARKCPVRPDRR